MEVIDSRCFLIKDFGVQGEALIEKQGFDLIHRKAALLKRLFQLIPVTDGERGMRGKRRENDRQNKNAAKCPLQARSSSIDAFQ